MLPSLPVVSAAGVTVSQISDVDQLVVATAWALALGLGFGPWLWALALGLDPLVQGIIDANAARAKPQEAVAFQGPGLLSKGRRYHTIQSITLLTLSSLTYLPYLSSLSSLCQGSRVRRHRGCLVNPRLPKS